MTDKHRRYKCEMCGKKVLQIQEHHIIPWYFSHDDSESNMMELCPFCHGKADSSFDNLILRGKMSVTHDTNKRATARYKRKYVRSKVLYGLHLLKHTLYEDILQYNAKTGHVYIYQLWGYRPHKYRDRSIKGYAQLSKAASAKGQVTLGI